MDLNTRVERYFSIGIVDETYTTIWSESSVINCTKENLPDTEGSSILWLRCSIVKLTGTSHDRLKHYETIGTVIYRCRTTWETGLGNLRGIHHSWKYIFRTSIFCGGRWSETKDAINPATVVVLRHAEVWNVDCPSVKSLCDRLTGLSFRFSS